MHNRVGAPLVVFDGAVVIVGTLENVEIADKDGGGVRSSAKRGPGGTVDGVATVDDGPGDGIVS